MAGVAGRPGRPARARRPGAVLLVAASALLLGGWLGGLFGGAPPVYDGLPLSSEPYRYLQPPPGFATTAPPASASEGFTGAAPGSGVTRALTTGESPPQATVVYSTGAFAGIAGRTVELRVSPVPPPVPVQPGSLDGNVYEVGVSLGSTAVAVAPDQSVTVALRATGRPGAPVVDELVGGAWRPLPTTHVPPSIYSVTVSSLGDFALVLPPGAASGPGGRGGAVVAIVAVSAAVLALAAVVALIRRRRGHSTA